MYKFKDFTQNVIRKTNTFQRIHKKCNKDLVKLIWKAETNMYAEPEEIKLDENDKLHYVPILKNLQCLLKNEDIKKEFKKQRNNNSNTITCFNDSNRYKNCEIFKKDELSFQLKLYIDAFTTTNPLADTRKKDKLQGLYYKLDNLDFSLQSKDYCTQLALLFDDLLIAKYGYEKILTRLIDDLKVLETVGILIDGLLIRGTISYICADSLGANSIFGLVESFGVNVTGFCRFCYGNDDDANIQTHSLL